MSHPDRHQRMTELFHRAVGLPPERREDFLIAECGDDKPLRDEMVGLLRAERAATVDAGAAVGAAAATVVNVLREGPGTRIGPYQLLEQIGEGGFGVVFMAEQETPVVRGVALKIIRLGMDTHRVIARFEAERQALAMMDHPNIARVLDAGATETGRPYFVMELVRGDPITEYCDKNSLSTQERLELFTQVCHAVQHAHQKGIIHRDIKPSNVLVTIVDGRPIPKVIDFGIAKAMHQRLTDKTLFTDHRHLIGTIEYMSPEQAELSGVDIDTRSDLYSLGVLLYELLTGTTPFDRAHLRSAALNEVQRIIREDEPPKPSTRLATVGGIGGSSADHARALADIAARRRTEPARLGAMLRGDLDWIVMRCLEKDRTRRYETANGLGADLRRHLNGEPVLAAPPGALYRARKFVRRNRGAVTAVGVVAITLVAGMVGTGAFAWRAVEARADAERRRKETDQVARFQAEMLSKINPAETGARLLQDLHDRFDVAAVKGGLPEDDRAARSRSFGDALAMINGTDAAASVLDRAVLNPAVQAIDERFADQPATDAALRQTVAYAYARLGLFETAEPLQRQALETRRRVLGSDDPATLESIYTTALLMSDLGRAPEARTLLSEVLERRRRLVGEDDTETIGAQIEIDRLGWPEGVDAAHEAATRALADRMRLRFDADHPYSIECTMNLANMLRELGRLPEAEQLYRDVLERRRRLLGDDDSATISAFNELGVVLQHQAKAAEAEPFLRQAVEHGRRLRGVDHRETIQQENNLLIVLKDLGRLPEAERLRRDVLERRRRVLGPLSPPTLDSMSKLGLMLCEQGRNAEAEPLLREALDGQRSRLGNRSGATLDTMNNLGQALQALGQPVEAEALLRESLDGARDQWGDENPSTITFINNLGGLYFAQRRLAEAEPYTRDALRLSRRVWGADDKRTLGSVWNMGFLLWMRGRQVEAEPFMRELIDANRRLSGEASPTTLKSEQDLATLLWELGRFDEAEQLARHVLAARRQAQGDDDPETVGSLTMLGRLLVTEGRLEEAERCLDESLQTTRKKPGEDNLAAARVAIGIGDLRRVQERLEEAEPLLRQGIDGFVRHAGEDRLGTVNARMSLAQVLISGSRFSEAEDQLLRAESVCPHALGVSAARHQECIERLAELYEKWDKAEPGKGHDTKMAQWRLKEPTK